MIVGIASLFAVAHASASAVNCSTAGERDVIPAHSGSGVSFDAELNLAGPSDGSSIYCELALWPTTLPPVLGETFVDGPECGSAAIIRSLTAPLTESNNLFGPAAGLITIGTTNDVLQFAVLKGMAFAQTDSGTPAALTNNSFDFFTFVDAVSSGAVTAATVQDPNLITHPLMPNATDLRLQFSASFTNKALLDAVFTNATYQFSITTVDGPLLAAITLPADNYPTNAPHVTNWSAAQGIDPTTPFTLTWDKFAGGTSNDFIELSIVDGTGSNVFATPSYFVDPSRLTGTNTSALIPASALTTGQTYQAELMFVKITSLDTNSVANAAGVGGFFTSTDFGLATVSGAGSLQFAASSFSVGEADGMATVTVVRVGGSAGTVTVDFATGNGTATTPANYIATTGTVTFADGQSNATFLVTIVDDNVYTGNKTVKLSLTNATNGAALGTISSAVLTIIDDDTTPGATRLDFLQSELDNVLACIANVSLTLISPDRPGAAAQIADCVAAAQQLLDDSLSQETVDVLGSKPAKKLQKQFASLHKRLVATQAVLEDEAQSDAKALNSLTKVSAFGSKSQKAFLKFKKEAPFVVLEQLGGQGGFHFSNQRVCYRIHVMDLAKGANCGPGTISVTNLYVSGDLIIVQENIIVKSDTDFCVLTGPAQGGAMITVTACGRSSSLPILNRIPSP